MKDIFKKILGVVGVILFAIGWFGLALGVTLNFVEKSSGLFWIFALMSVIGSALVFEIGFPMPSKNSNSQAPF